MPELVELEPTAFVLACRHSDFKLFVQTTSYLSRNTLSRDLQIEIQSLRGLWLQSPGQCQLQICVEKDGIVVEDQYTLEHIATAIVSCSLWSELALLAELEEIHFDASENVPNIYLTVEHQDKSNALLAPGHMETAQFFGLQCLLNFQGDICVVKNPALSQTEPGSSSTLHADETKADFLWDRLDEFLDAALREAVGVRKKLVDMKKTKITGGHTLIDTAPAVWNANYLENIAEYAKHLPLLSGVLSSCTQAHNPSLRKKATAIVNGQEQNLTQSASAERRMQRLLWEQVLETTKTLQSKPRTLSKKTTEVTLNEEHMDLDPMANTPDLKTKANNDMGIRHQEMMSFDEMMHDPPSPPDDNLYAELF